MVLDGYQKEAPRSNVHSGKLSKLGILETLQKRRIVVLISTKLNIC